MANDIDAELYPRNNAHTTADPTRWRRNPTTGVREEVPVTGLTDLRVYLSTSDTATDHTSGALNAALVYVMTEVVPGLYEATILGSALATHVASTDGSPLYVHWQSPSAGYHEFAQVTWRTKRPAAT